MSAVQVDDAIELLRDCVGEDAAFRPHQWEAIDKLVNQRERLLLVQRTGWGKSTVYFIATHLLREQGSGPTLIISPLLSLMRNQIQDAEVELGLDARTIHSGNESDWDDIKTDVTNGDCDLLLVSPERLNNREFRRDVLDEMAPDFGMLVVDEAHCVSNWGHDFRPDYREIKPLVERLPDETPIVATTATANDRVVEDVTTQLPDLEPIRGRLVRDSIHMQTIEMEDPEERLAWLAENFPDTDRAGIIYCLTTRDVNMVAEWLSAHDYDVEPYHGSMGTDRRQAIEQQLLDNELDAAVATSALGMGFNKPDLEFVIHFQRPPNLIRYYQEIGRAGRDLDDAYAVLLAGEEDDDIAEHFIEEAFPEQSDFEAVLEAIEESDGPIGHRGILKRQNIGWSDARQCLDMLTVDDAIRPTDGGYVRTDEDWTYDWEMIERVTEHRREELQRIKEFVATDACLTEFVDDELDGDEDGPCGHCANCTEPFYPEAVSDESVVEAAAEFYLGQTGREISPRKRVHNKDGSSDTIPEELRVMEGRALCFWEDPGWGYRVQDGRDAGMFSAELVDASTTFIEEDWQPSPEPAWVTAVPSTSSPGLVTGFAAMIADELDLPFKPVVEADGSRPSQRDLENSYQQCWNVKGAFDIEGSVPDGPVLLVDDVISSRWTVTEVGKQLRKAGSGVVYPYALAERW